MSYPAGRQVPLTPYRKLITDLMYFARQVPAVTLDRRMDLSALVAARQKLAVRPGWCAIFIKAFALVAARRPELRRAYMPYPWAHLYEHGCSVAAVIVERMLGNEEIPLMALLRGPERHGLAELDAYLRYYQNEPLENLGCYRRARRLGRFPWFVRRLVWWAGLKILGSQRAHYMGTFNISSTGSRGAGLLHVLTPLSCGLHYGLIDDCGHVDVRFTFDHRVLDGSPVARALVDLERVFTHEILDELTNLAPTGTPAQAA